jgi:DNA-binding CsgD family transcriptional regulator
VTIETLGEEQLLARLGGLTMRQMRVLALAPRRLSQVELAQALDISEAAAASAGAEVRRRFGLPSRVELAEFVEDHPRLFELVAAADERGSHHVHMDARRIMAQLRTMVGELERLHHEAERRAAGLTPPPSESLADAERRRARESADDIRTFLSDLHGRVDALQKG